MIEFELFLPKCAQVMGKRLFLNPNLFAPFGHLDFLAKTERTLPISFSFPASQIDSLVLTLPDGFALEAGPVEKNIENDIGYYTTKHSWQGNRLTFIKESAIKKDQIPADQFDNVKTFFQAAIKADKEKFIFKR